MQIVIVGPGALGSLLAARISRYLESGRGNGADNDLHVCLLDYRPERALFLAQNGLILEEGDREFHCSPEVTADSSVCARADVLFLCLKANVLSSSLAELRRFLFPRHLLLAMQNGISHLELVPGLPCHCGVGVTSEGATLLSPGRVRHGGRGLTRLGLFGDPSSAAEDLLARLAVLLNASGLVTEITSEPLIHVWAKLFVNVGINALTAIHRCRNGELLASPDIVGRMTQAVREAEQVARALNIPVKEDPVEVTFKVCRSTADNISSMHQDVISRRRTEIDAINGAVVAAGQRLGIPTPVNADLVRQVRDIEASYEEEMNGGGNR